MTGGRRPVLIWLSETERICDALDEMATAGGDSGLVEATIAALRAAHRDAARAGLGNAALRFLAPPGAEQLVVIAAIRARRPRDP